MDGFDAQCGACGAHFQLDPAGSIQDAACSECGGNRFFRSQPSPTQSDGALRDQVDMSVGGKDQGGNPLGEGTIVGNDGERPAGKRDNYMHSHRINVESAGWPQNPRADLYQIDPEYQPKVAPLYHGETEIDPNDEAHLEGFFHRPDRADAVPNAVLRGPQGDTTWTPIDSLQGFQVLEGEVPPHLRHLLPERASSVYEDIGQAAHGQPEHIQHILRDMLMFEGPAQAQRFLQTLQHAPNTEQGSPLWDSMGSDPMGGYVVGKAAHTVAKRVDMQLNTTPYAPLWDESYIPKSAGIAAPLLEGAGSLAARALPFALPSLMKGALGGGGGQQAGGMAPQQPDPAPSMEALGSVDIPWLLTADMDTPQSVKSVGEQEDDPQQQDQKEFNDGDKSPSNLKNPNNDDSGALGEDQVRQDAGFAPDSPGVERAMMILPLLLHYFQSEDSGQDDPLIRALHDALEQESPGYLDNEHPDGHKHVEILLQQNGHGGHTAGVNAFPGGLPATPMPGAGVQPPGTGGGTCPTCGGVLAGDGTCPQCGAKQHPQGGELPTGMGTGMSGGASYPPGMMAHGRTANTVGPQTPEQKAAVIQLLQQQGRGNEEPNVELHPEQYWRELAQIQKNPNVAPLVDPSQAPQPPQPMMDPQGAMPVTDPTQMGGGGGQPMQPMARVAGPNLGRPTGIPPQGGDPTVWWNAEYDPQAPNWNKTPFDTAPCPACGMPSGMNMQGRCRTCGYIIGDEDGLSQGGLGLNEYNPGGKFVDPPGFTHPGDSHGPSSGHFFGKTADANNRVPRCPTCGTATTTYADGGDGTDEARGFCHSCQKNFPLPKHEARVILADLPNPVLDNAADRTSVIPEDPGAETTLTFHDKNGQPLLPGAVYSLYRPGYAVPDEVKVVDAKPDQVDLKLVGQSAGVVMPGTDEEPDLKITAHDFNMQKLEFVPIEDEKNQQPLGGMPGLEQIPQSEPTTDEIGNSYPNPGTVSRVLVASDDEMAEMDEDTCHKCGSHDVQHTASSPTKQMHECWRCGSAWETDDDWQGRESSVDLSWLYDSNSYGDDFFSEMERARAMRQAGQSSRNIGDIAAKDPRLQAIRERLDANASVKDGLRTAGRHFTPSEQRELINERGLARNADMLDLTGTHYELRDAHSGNGQNVPDGHLIFGL